MVTPKPVKAKPTSEGLAMSAEVKPTKKLFKVNKIFAQWVVSLEVEEGDDYDSLLQKAMKAINDRRIIPNHPEHDHVLEEFK